MSQNTIRLHLNTKDARPNGADALRWNSHNDFFSRVYEYSDDCRAYAYHGSAVTAVESNGGTVLMPDHDLGEWGRRAIVIDSEGNRIALHSS